MPSKSGSALRRYHSRCRRHSLPGESSRYTTRISSTHPSKKDMILSGGQNIYPADIENVMREHSAIAQVAVIGIASECCGMA
jgi:acyl-CoA synthetase (AMP-forming)/AMP-acid ligase II